ncbi:MFS transporter [Enemella dayhoffiae]|nr:MFS transporter [Enemella dayhoffiae]
MFLIGLGMGGATPSLLALTAEYSPNNRRGTYMTLVLLGLPGGALIGGLVAAAWLPLVGWRGIFLIGGLLPVLLIVAAFELLPESPGFLASKDRTGEQTAARRVLRRAAGIEVTDGVRLGVESSEANNGSVASLFSPRYRLVTVAVWAVYLFNWIAWFLLLQWMPTAIGLGFAGSSWGLVFVLLAPDRFRFRRTAAGAQLPDRKRLPDPTAGHRDRVEHRDRSAGFDHRFRPRRLAAGQLRPAWLLHRPGGAAGGRRAGHPAGAGSAYRTDDRRKLIQTFALRSRASCARRRSGCRGSPRVP